MDESRNKILKEAYINSFKKNELNHSNKIGKQIEPEGEHIHTFKGGHKLYHYNDPDITGKSTFSVHGPDGTKHVHLTTRRNHAGSHYVGLAASSGQGPKMHDVYHHLLKSGHVKTLVGDNSQSRGAVKVWQRLNRKKDVHIHGWDDDEAKPVNLGKHFDPDETHTQNNNYYKIYKDSQNTPSEKDRKKYSQAMDDHEQQSRMRLVAHLKEAMINSIRKKQVDDTSEYGIGQKVKPEGEHIGTLKGGYTLHHTHSINDWRGKKMHHFTIHGPDGTKHVHLHTSHGSRPEDVNSAHHVEWAESSGQGPKMHDVYHHLLKSGHVKALESRNQSPGAVKVWQRLNRKKDVNIHGWNWNKSEPVNFGKRFDPDETHRTYHDGNKIDDDKLDTMKKRGRDHEDIQKYNDESSDNYDKIGTSLIAHLKEVATNQIGKGDSTPHLFGSSKGEHIGTLKGGYEIYHEKPHEHDDDYHIFHVKGPDGLKHARLSTRSKDGKNHAISMAASSGKGPKMHDVYHHLLKSGRVHTLSTDSQSPGAVKTWQRLNRKKSVNIHGWDPYEKKPVNLGKRFDTDDTHVDYHDVEKSKADRNTLYKRHEDEDAAVRELHHTLEKRRMHLVAHLKEAELNNIMNRHPDLGDDVIGNHISTMKGGYRIHHEPRGAFEHTFHVYDKDNQKHVRLRTYTNTRNSKNHTIDMVRSTGKGPKLHDVYHHMLKHGHVDTFNSDSQSPGAVKVWQRLNRKKDVNIHGWDPKEEKPVNLGKRFDPDETHRTHHDTDNARDDYQNIRRNNPKDLKSAHADLDDEERIKRMHLVAHLKEVLDLDDVGKDEKFGHKIGHKVSDNDGPIGKKISSFKGHDLHHHVNPKGHHVYSVVDPKTQTKHVQLTGYPSDKHKGLEIGTLVSTGKGPKAHELYHHMLKHGHVSHLTTDSQSEGGRKVWEKLNRKRDVHIHGWDTDNEKPVNLGKRFDHEETHSSFRGYTKLTADRSAASKRKSEIEVGLKGGKFNRRHLARAKKDLDHANDEIQHAATRERMQLVAHLKEVKSIALGKEHKFGVEWDEKPDTFFHGEKISSFRGHDVHQIKSAHGRMYTVFDKDGNKHIAMGGHDSGGGLKIGAVASSGKGPKVHDFYHHLLKKGHEKHLIGNEQSEGGKKVWQNLNRKRSVNIHGWNPHTEKPVNLGKKFDPDETHRTSDEVHKAQDEYSDRKWNDYHEKKKDTRRAKKDYKDETNIRNMHLVAHLKEDAPGNAVGGGHVAGLGVGPMGEPGVHHRRGKFGKYDTFLVSPDTFLKARSEKKKGAHWRKYLEEDEQYNVIREYAFKQPKKPIILQCERTGAMCFARYGLR